MEKESSKSETISEHDEDPTNPVLTQEEFPEPFSYKSAFLQTVKNILLVCGSFDVPWSLVFLSILIGHLQTSNSDEANPLDVAPLTLTIFESLIVVFISIYFGYQRQLNPMFSKLNQSTNNEINLDEENPETQLDEQTQLLTKLSPLQHTLIEMGSMYKVGMLISIPLITLIILPCVYLKPILDLLGQDPNTAAAAQQFSRLLSISVAPILIRFLMEQYFYSANKFRVPLMIAGPNLLIGTCLGSFLTFGPPKLGLDGIAWGFLTSAILSAIGFTFYGNRFEPFSEIPFYSQWDRKLISQQVPTILKNGVPFMLQYAGELSAGFALSVFAGLLGNNPLASWNFSQSLLFLTKIFQIASGVFAQNRFGLINESAPREARIEAFISAAVSFLLVALFCVPTMIEPKLAIWLFSNTASPEVEALARNMLRIFAAALLVSSPNPVFMFVPKNKGDIWKPHAITIASIWAGTGGGYLLANQAKLGVDGLAIGYAAGVTAATAINGIRFFNTLRLPSKPEMDIQQSPEDIESFVSKKVVAN